MIYVCVPAHDEGPTLGPLLWKVRKVFRAFGREFHIVVLDDASRDDTAEVLERYDGVLPLTVLKTEARIGYGAAADLLLRHVAEVAPYPKRDAAIVLQADLTEDPEVLVDLTKALEGGADLVAGAAQVDPDHEPRPRVWGRRLARWVLGRTLTSAPVEDPLEGLRAYRIIALRKALRDRSEPLATAAEPWVANLEILAAVVGHARRVESLPFRHRRHLLAREPRFQVVPVLKQLWRHRGIRWPEVGNGAPRAAGDQAA